jgi:general secretion pathway protein H
MMPQTDAEAGFTLIEVVCVLAITGLLAALVLPAIPRGTSQERLAGYAVEVAALLKGDRNAAIRSHAQVATSLDAERRIVISGATASIVEIPADVTFEALLAQRCGDRLVGATIDFFPGRRISDSRQLAHRRRRSCADPQILRGAESPALP